MTWPDIEGALRDYLRADAGVSTLVGNRVFFGLPPRVAFPAVIIRRVGGGDDPSEAPIDRPLVAIDCWGKPKNKADAFALAAAVRDALTAIRRTTQDSTVLYGANVIGAIFFPDPETDQPRYALTVDVTARAVPAA
jgi:hypothetical protein